MAQDECAQELPPLVLQGIKEFNERKFFEQHETLEAAWRQEPRPVRELYQGILQVGVAWYQIERGNLPGAVKIFERALKRLRRFAPACMGVDVARLIAGAERIRGEAQRLGPDRLDQLDRALYPKVTLTTPSRNTGMRDQENPSS